ncbi:MAG: tetratricopeptide repeat protein, partial [Candidatus Methylomirabilis sp.]|nr:tetratricopeptide repeat protein [Deltaproteobacteria bacterium]
YYERAAALAPNWARALGNLGALQIAGGRCDEAARTLERATLAASQYSLAYANWGRALECAGDDPGAARIYDLAYALPSPSIHLLLARGALALRQGDLSKAEASFRPLIEAETPSAEALTAAAARLLENGSDAAKSLADEAYARALEAGGASSVALNNNLGVLARRQGDFAKARERYYAALERDATAAAVHNNLGVLAVLEGNPKLALTNYEKALSIRPDLKEALLNLGILHELYFDDPSRARAYYERFDKAGGARPERLRGLAEMRGEKGKEG